MIIKGLSDALKDGVNSGLEKGLGKGIDGLVQTVLNSLWKNPAYPVIAGGQCLLIEHGIDPAKAWGMSRECLISFLKDERIEFGNPDYGWSPDDGRALVQSYEIDHWEGKP